MPVTPSQFIKWAWELDLRICSADKDLLGSLFIEKVSALAVTQGIAVYYLDFSTYESPEQVLLAPENDAFKRALENPSGKVLLWFDNCDSLAPLYCAQTFQLRSILTTNNSSDIQSVFIAQRSGLIRLFYDSRAAFYQSNHNITSCGDI
ncbi:hypothetical protein [Vibrio sp. F74]|uniref:hypothetical protein n=1 Tax=Vibrio sp. F74 TaxID=700020 RepID=UPI0035F59D3D